MQCKLSKKEAEYHSIHSCSLVVIFLLSLPLPLIMYAHTHTHPPKPVRIYVYAASPNQEKGGFCYVTPLALPPSVDAASTDGKRLERDWREEGKRNRLIGSSCTTTVLQLRSVCMCRLSRVCLLYYMYAKSSDKYTR